MRIHEFTGGATRCLVIIAAVLVGACASTVNRLGPELPRLDRAPRIVVMPPDVELSQLTAGGTQEPQADWTDEAHRNIAAAFAAEAKARNLTFFEYAPENGSPADRAMAREVIKLHRVVGESVLTHNYTSRLELPTKAGRFDWSVGSSAAAIGRAQNADYALFIAVRDSYATTGRYAVVAANLLLRTRIPMSIPLGAQVGFASLVDLRTGDIVWFNQLSRGSGDLRTPEAARETLKVLLTDLPS